MNVTGQEPTMTEFAFRYEHSDIPEGTTLREYRAAKRPAPRRRGLRQVIQRLAPTPRATLRVRHA